LHGQLSFQDVHIPLLRYGADGLLLDTVLWDGRLYWPLGPLPAIVLMPFVALFGTSVPLGFVSFGFTVLNFYLLYRIARWRSFAHGDSFWLATFFIFGSAYLGVAAHPTSWYFAHIVTVTSLLLAVHCFFSTYRYRVFFAGACVALAVATRNTVILASLFFMFFLYTQHPTWKERLWQAVVFCAPIGLCGALLLGYNWGRFGSPWETGYALATVSPVYLPALQHGLFSLAHIPGNLYIFLLKGPDAVREVGNAFLLRYPYITANPWGMGIFFTSPVLIYLFCAKWRDPIVKASALTSLLLFLSVVAYYGSGAQQFGYRYALDFYPFLFLLLCSAFAGKLPFAAKLLIVVGVLFDLYLWFNFQFMPVGVPL
jgi:hypothetical protein